MRPTVGPLRSALPAVLLLAALLGGCAAKAPTNDACGRDQVHVNGGDCVQLAEPDNTPTTGSISGVVVDEAIRPQAKVNVTVQGADTQMTTDEQGLFVFSDLEPGLYTILANASGFLAAQSTAEVLAGETAKVRLVLPTDTTPKPFHQTLSFDGFVQAGSGLVNEAYDLFVGDTVGVFSCTCRYDFDAEAKPSTMVFETIWDPTVANPAAAPDAYWTIYDKETHGASSQTYVSGGCTDPCYGVADGGKYDAAALHFYSYIWLEGSWVVVNQKFSQYITLFYNGEAPEGWSFVNGDP